jgi:hypothetical protein
MEEFTQRELSLFRDGPFARRSENRTGAYWVVREERKRSDNAADGPR